MLSRIGINFVNKNGRLHFLPFVPCFLLIVSFGVGNDAGIIISNLLFP